MTTVEMPTTSAKPKRASRAKTKPIPMNTRTMMSQKLREITDEERYEKSVPLELKFGVKGLVIKAASLPAKANKVYLESTLSQSVFVTNYLNKYLMVNQIAELSDHVQAVLVYSFHLFNAFTLKPPLRQEPTA